MPGCHSAKNAPNRNRSEVKIATGDFHLLTRIRRRLRKISIAVLLWRFAKKALKKTRYYIPRVIGHATYPILGQRAALRGYYDKTRDFLRHGDGHYIELEPRSGASSDALKPEIFVAIIPRGRSLYDYGVVVSPDHRLLADVSWANHDLPDTTVSQPLCHPAMYKLHLPPIQHIPGRVAIMNSLWPDNYYHWMFDILPRFEFLHRSGLVPDRYVINTNTPFQKESLQILSIPSHQILSPTKDTYIEADELIVPSLPGPVFGGGQSPQLRACEYLRKTFLQKERTQKPRRALYITRNDAKERRVINEAEILEEILEYGFEVISLSNMPLVQQVELFSEAKIIVGSHGSGLANAVFCQPGSVLIEFMPERRQVDFFEKLARLVGMEYYSIAGTEDDNSNGHLHDHTVDRAALRKLLRRLKINSEFG